jgi:hypothetical protein
VVALVAVASVVALAACGDGDGRVADTEVAIAGVLADRLADADLQGEVVVACPDDADLDTGSRLVCDVAVGGASAQPVAFDVGPEGELALAASVIPTVAAEAYLAGELSTAAGDEVEVSCGDRPLLVGDVGDRFECDAVRSDGAVFEVAVEITGLDGAVRYDVATTSTTSTMPTTPTSLVVPTDPATRPTVGPP